MGTIQELYSRFGKVDFGDITSNQKKELYKVLSSIKADEISTLDEHKMFLEVLQKLRRATAEDTALYGKNFRETIQSLLSVGEDGVYSNSKRFIYELIQNVDDCEYENVEDCHLDIQFDYAHEQGRIILTYNEKGFTPANVFAITGIAEKAKNISADKVEIGEKGIGFKSVFGIADKVIIESGMFSFELMKENFTVPILRYKGFKPVSGTRMTLEMSNSNAQAAFRSILEEYRDKTSVLRQNPILFLNKLTHLKIYFDAFRYIEFDVERKAPEKHGKLLVEKDVIVSADMKDHINGSDRVYRAELHCTRYTMPIKYGESECVSRYGQDVDFTYRNHNLIMIMPYISDDLSEFEKGLLYSFLPTQIRINAPVVMHVPFKLDGSREYVDPQGKNQWFNFTIENLEAFLRAAYVDAALDMRQTIIRYIPNKHNFFFDKANNPKVECLCVEGLRGDDIGKEKVFFTEGGTFEPASNVVAFAKDSDISNPTEIFKLLGLKKKLFIPPMPIDMNWYNCEVIQNVKRRLFGMGLEDESKFARIIEILEENEDDFDYYSVLNTLVSIPLTASQLMVIAKCRKLADAFVRLYRNSIEKKQMPAISLAGKLELLDDETQGMLNSLLDDVDLAPIFSRYIYTIKTKIYVLDGVKRDFAIAGQNGIILSKENALSSFGLLASPYDENRVFSASLTIRQASDRLNAVNEDIPNDEYLRLLREVRQSLKNAFGNRTYESYLSLIKKAGSDKRRFFNELLQNADDCAYGAGVTPMFSLTYRSNYVDVTYNENGFTKDNIRAITAIGESTKKLLLSGDASIGEKGVGFKSVFGVASEVEIHSNGFDFKLKEKTPTIPERCEHKEVQGTAMHFSMKESVKDAFTDSRILQLCVCLRNLKVVEINGKRLTITDKDNKRTIAFEGKRYHFERVEYEFEVDDVEALEERSSNKKIISGKQKIICYIPKDYNQTSFLYVGLPTDTECSVPLIIDAPFELTTSRDSVLQNKWNDIIREKMYEAIINVLHTKKEELRIDILKFIAFSNQNGQISFPMFSDKYINTCNWVEMLSCEDIMPLAFEDGFAAIDDYDCVIIPDVLASIGPGIDEQIDGLVIDTFHKSQYMPLLEFLGAKRSNILDDLDCIADYPEKIRDEEFRKALYNYLFISLNQQKLGSPRVYEKIRELEIFPIKTKMGVEYVSFSKNIYISNDKVSDGDILVLDTKILSADRIFLYTNEHINELTPEVYDAKYQNALVAFLRSDKSDEEKAKHLLREFVANRPAIDKCKETLKGMIDEIPMLMASGAFQPGNKYINNNGLKLSGEVISQMFVDTKYEDLARYLGCSELLEIHYDDIDFVVDEISDQDIDEILTYFTNYSEIILGYLNDEIITEEQIEKFHLQYYLEKSHRDDDLYEEDFPGRAVKDIKRVRRHVADQFKTSPNPYVERQRTVREPRSKVNTATYTTSMYASKYNEGKCFCQMCKRMVDQRYIERNDIQKKPDFGWEQMYLSLCLTCSKDYILLRNNKAVWEHFLHDIKEAEIEGEETVEIEIGGDQTISFTGVHIAEIQAIFDVIPKKEFDDSEEE